MSTQFSAPESLLGYLYQVRAALLLAITRFQRDPQLEVVLETLDDVTFDRDGEPIELVQTKHHVNRQANLTDASVDLWKTIRIWIHALADGRVTVPGTLLSLVTTAQASAGSAAGYLRAVSRDIVRSEELLLHTARTSTNEENAATYDAFIKLTSADRRALLDAITVFDRAVNIVELDAELKAAIRLVIEDRYAEAFLDRLEAWWMRRAILNLTDASRGIKAAELLGFVHDLRNQFGRDSLPIDYILAEPPDGVAVDEDTRTFVHQLRLISISSKRIETAIREYYRAFEQRSRWIREDLLHLGELERYELILIDEWERRRDVLEDELAPETDEDKLKLGQQLFKWVELDADIPIRNQCQHGFVMRGSYHMLADGPANAPRVGWHPDFISRLRELLRKPA